MISNRWVNNDNNWWVKNRWVSNRLVNKWLNV